MKCLLFLVFFPAISALAGLTWQNTEVTIKADPDAQFVSGSFKFKNETNRPVTITETKTSCGCTTAKLEKKNYAPGESGEIVAHFDLGTRVGPQQKTVTVTTDDKSEKPVELELNVDIPDAVETSPAKLIWKRGEKSTEQIFTVKARPGFKVHVKDVRCSNALFTAKIDSAKEGSTYQISVTPNKPNEAGFGLVIVTTDFPAANPRVVYAQLQVQ